MQAAVMVYKGTHLPGEETEIIKSHLRCDCATFAIQLCPFLHITTTHVMQQMMACSSTVVSQTLVYQKLLLFGMILPGSALLPMLVLLMQQVLLVASPADGSIVSQTCHISVSCTCEESTASMHITGTDQNCQHVDDNQDCVEHLTCLD